MQTSFLNLPIPRYLPSLSVDYLPPDEELSPLAPNKQLVDSIKKHGVLNPVVVQVAGKRYRLIYGNRRLKAARSCGMETVPALVYEQGAELPADITVVENEHRSSNPIELYFQIKALVEKEITDKQIATQLGLPLNKVRPYLAMAQMDKVGDFERAWLAKQVSEGFIKSIAKRSKQEQALALQVLEENGHATLDDLKQVRKAAARQAIQELDALAPNLFGDNETLPYCTKAKAAGDRVEIELFVKGERKTFDITVDKLLELA